MTLHSSLSGADLHDPKGVSPTPLTLPDNTANAYLIENDSSGDDYFQIVTTNSSEELIFGNASDNPAYTFKGINQASFECDLTVNRGLRFESPTVVDASGTTDLSSAMSVVLVDSATAGGTVTLGLPVPGEKSLWLIKDIGGDASTHNVVLDRSNGGAIEGSASNHTLSTDYFAILLYTDGNDFWIF